MSTIIHHLGIMEKNLGSGVGVAELCLVPCFATTPTALHGGGRRDVGIAVAAFRFVAAFARTPIPSQPSEKKPVIVGVLEPSWLAGFARTSTVAEGSKAEARSSGVADYPLAAGFATTPLHLGPSASMPLGSTTSPGMWVAGVALLLFVAIFKGTTPATPTWRLEIRQMEPKGAGATWSGGRTGELGCKDAEMAAGASGHPCATLHRHLDSRIGMLSLVMRQVGTLKGTHRHLTTRLFAPIYVVLIAWHCCMRMAMGLPIPPDLDKCSHSPYIAYVSMWDISSCTSSGS